MLGFWRLGRRLRDAGVIGINQRNLEIIFPSNPRRNYRRVDDKLLTKRLCIEHQIPVPELYGAAASNFELKDLREVFRQRGRFVLKPSRGAMGNGTFVIRGYEDGAFLRAGGTRMSEDELLYQASGILAGLYSLGGRPDACMVEELLVTHEALRPIATDGVPDVRVILYRGIPIMSMMRLPTRSAGGRANLHQGAVGVGVHLVDGSCRHAILRNRPIRTHPDSGEELIGRVVPEFERILEISMRTADQSGLGYVGADIVVDQNRGPVVLELNARPGLSIQIANRAGLLPRLRAVEATRTEGLDLAARLALGREIAASFPGEERR
ncbi:MAG: alpha-L-glutamate ligase-like protein [Myxococcota bacterium]